MSSQKAALIGHEQLDRLGDIEFHRLARTARGVPIEIAQAVLKGEGGSQSGRQYEIAELAFALVATKTSLTVRFIDMDNPVQVKSPLHIAGTYVGKDEPALLSNCHHGVSEWINYTLHFQDPSALRAYRCTGAFISGLGDPGRTFYDQNIAWADEPGSYGWFPQEYFNETYYLFGGQECIASTRAVLENRGFLFDDQPLGWQGQDELDALAEAAMRKSGVTWPLSVDQVKTWNAQPVAGS